MHIVPKNDKEVVEELERQFKTAIEKAEREKAQAEAKISELNCLNNVIYWYRDKQKKATTKE